MKKKYGKKQCIRGLIVLALLLCVCGWSAPASAQAATMFEWDRNVDVDTEHYEMYMCATSSTCVPGTGAVDRIGVNISQPAIGVKPNMPFPPGKVGRAAVLAVDLVGNKSLLSNIVPFADSQAPAAPTNLTTK